MYLCFNWPEPSPPVFSVPLATVQLWPHNPQYLIGCLDCPSNCLETLWPGEPKREQRQRLRKHRGNDYPRIHSIIISTWLCSPTSPTVTPMIISNDLIIIKPFVILIGVMEFISSACQMIISSVRNMDGARSLKNIAIRSLVSGRVWSTFIVFTASKLFVKYVFQSMIKSFEAGWRADAREIQRLQARGSQTDRSTDIPLWSPVQSGVAAGTAPVSDGVYTRTVQRRSLSRPAGPGAWNTQEVHITRVGSYYVVII